jgi:aspartyl-tRNA(Asn)/glutamyl-tRNA(Gln) amidotransferase subunit A
MPTKFGELLNDPIKNMMGDLYTGMINIVGVPSAAIPCGFSSEGLPIGMQLVGKMFGEETLIQLSNAYQGTTKWHQQKPTYVGK